MIAPFEINYFLFDLLGAARRGAAPRNLGLGAPDCCACFDLRLGPHWRYLLALFAARLADCTKCNQDAKSTTTPKRIVLLQINLN